MSENTYIISPEIPMNFNCDVCDYMSSNKKDYTKHILTQKHKILTNTYINTSKFIPLFNCNCGKSYKHRQRLYNHKKLCDYSRCKRKS